MKYRILAFLLVCALAFGLTTSASAQTYSFQLPKEEVQVYWNGDGTVAVDYRFTFANDAAASPIDFVDVGLPNGDYAFNSITADVDGSTVSVTKDYQGEGSYGVAIDLGSHDIQPGKTGTVHVYIGHIERFYYPDDKDENYVSGEFSPTWFGSKYVSGATDLSVTFHLPPGVKAEEPRYHPARGGWPGSAEPVAGLDQQGRVTYTWRSPDANGYTQYTFGASYPKQYIPDSAVVRTSIIDELIGAVTAVMSMLSGILPFCCFGAFFFGIPILGAVNDRRRKMQYLPPKISIEGHGIKRGLTAVEAGVLMGLPLDKVMTMILFSTIKKGAAQVVSRDPLKIETLPEGQASLQPYETEFLDAMVKDDRQRRKDLQAMTVKLVKSVAEKMKGFSRKETLEYYKTINEKAWQQIEAAGTPEVKSQMFEEALEWTMLDRDYDDRARRTFTGPIFVPMWWGRYDPVYRGSMPHTAAPSMPSMPSGSGGRASLPGADFAAAVVTGTQNFAQRVLGNVNDFTSGVTNVTNPPPKTSGGSYRSGGGGCACACACAGCACACAGGGR
jgi:hypothetical protein